MSYLRKFNKQYLRAIYFVGDKISHPLWMILSIWIPLTTIILLLNYEVISTETLVRALVYLSIPIIYSTILLYSELRAQKKKYKELKQLGVKVFGQEQKYKVWMYSEVMYLGNKRPIDIDPDQAREVLIKLDNGISV